MSYIYDTPQPQEKVALGASAVGYFVFPVDPASKKPLVKDWPNVATRDSEIIQSYWAAHPNAMVGVVTGEKSNLFVLDFDVKDGEDVWDKVYAFQRLHGPLLPTITIQTPSGGLHFYYQMPIGVDLRNSTGKLAEGVDVRANGGYVVFAGSIRADGKMYQILREAN